jgi:hypothetical protein
MARLPRRDSLNQDSHRWVADLAWLASLACQATLAQRALSNH